MPNTPDTYFVISCSEDGDIYVSQCTQEKLTEDLTDELQGVEFFIPGSSDYSPMYWNGRQVIIKGRAIIPRPVETVTRFVVD